MAKEEKFIKHLEFIQNVISRMANNSFLLKGWTVTLVAAFYALAAQGANPSFAFLALFPIIAFWILDAYYLRQERLFRALYNDIRNKEDAIHADAPFNMGTKPFEATERCWLQTMFSKTIAIFYLTVFFSVAVVIILIKA